ncbi:MAG: PDZ domain-containing protein [Planctomycetes bacterium]|nr:PDZ domain-containing protein [Planctomycetota bacterium]
MKKSMASIGLLLAASSLSLAAIRQDAPAPQGGPAAMKARPVQEAQAEPPEAQAPAQGRSMIGVHVAPVGEALAAQLGIDPEAGILVEGVVEGLPADHAGMRRFDVITAVNGEKVSTMRSLSEAMAQAAPGSEITVSLLRGGELLELTVGVVAEEEDPSWRVFEDAAGGVRLEAELARQELEVNAARLQHEAQALKAEMNALRERRFATAEEREAAHARARELEEQLAQRHAELDHLHARLQELSADLARRDMEEQEAQLRDQTRARDAEARMFMLLKERQLAASEEGHAGQARARYLEELLAQRMAQIENLRSRFQGVSQDVMSRLSAQFAELEARPDGALSLEQRMQLQLALKRAQQELQRALESLGEQLSLPQVRVIEESPGIRSMIVGNPFAPVPPAPPAYPAPPVPPAAPYGLAAESAPQTPDEVLERLGRIEERLAKMEQLLHELLRRENESD